MASGTRTAPAVTGTAQNIVVSITYLSLVEESPRSHSYIMDALSTDAQIEAFVDAMQAETTASIVEVSVARSFSGALSKTNATADGRPSFEDKIRIGLKNVALKANRYYYVPAPVNTNFEANSENLITDVATNTALGALLTAITPVQGSFAPSTIGFVEHNERQPSIAL